MNERPWENEPDRLEWVYKEIACLILRNPHIGTLCGYVGVPSGHLLFELDYDGRVIDSLDVHGGITFAGTGSPWPEQLWWIGFDCAHAGDFMPKLAEYFSCGIYRDIAYVKAETEQLADQVLALA